MNINKETLNLIIVSIYIYILFKYIENDDYYSMGVLTLVTGVIVYKINDMNIIEGNVGAEQDPAEPDALAETETEPEPEPEPETETEPEPQQEPVKTKPVYDSVGGVEEDNNKYAKLREQARGKGEVKDGPVGAGSIINDDKSASGKETTKKENFKEGKEVKMSPMDDLFRMGPYDSLCLSKEEDKDYELATDEELKNLFGVQVPLVIGKTNNEDLTGPSVDGDKDSPQKLSMLANNKINFECCTTSPFTTNSGCICLTKKQVNFLKTRGLNKSAPDI